MRILFSCLLLTLLTVGLTVNDAYAKRFGGGRSFGVQRSQSSFFQKSPNSTNAAFAQRNNTHKWGGMLGGLLVGGLLTSLFMGHGLGTGLLSWLIVGGLIFFLIGFWRQRIQPGFQVPQGGNFNHFSMGNASTNSSSNSNYQPSSDSLNTLAGFSSETFLRDAKVKFIRLQAAYDQKNLQDLSSFTAPEVFAEIQMQLEERGNEPNKTEVTHLEAELLDASKEANSNMASVRFTGIIKENNHSPERFNEIWHFRQFNPMSEWVVGGIQQE